MYVCISAALDRCYEGKHKKEKKPTCRSTEGRVQGSGWADSEPRKTKVRCKRKTAEAKEQKNTYLNLLARVQVLTHVAAVAVEQ